MDSYECEDDSSAFVGAFSWSFSRAVVVLSIDTCDCEEVNSVFGKAVSWSAGVFAGVCEWEEVGSGTGVAFS